MEPLKTSIDADGAESDTLCLDMTTRLAFERTRVAYDNTVMAAVRTATSLITFGFTIYKFFEFEIQGRERTNHFFGPREFGITMILIGITFLSMSWFEYSRDRRVMRKNYPDLPRSTAGLLAGMIAGLGIFALLAAVLRA
jgi:putative membrane protein